MALKLWLITPPRWWLITYSSAVTICGKPVVPSSSEVGVSTSRMLAPGAIAWAYSTSRSVSPAQPSRSEFGWYAGTGPAGWMTFSDGGAGRPAARSNRRRSRWTVGDPNESTMMIVCPRPVIPFRYSRGRL